MASFSTSKEAQGTTPAKNRIPSYGTGQSVLQHRTYQCPTAPDSCPTKCPTAPDIQTGQPVLRERTYLELTTLLRLRGLLLPSPIKRGAFPSQAFRSRTISASPTFSNASRRP